MGLEPFICYFKGPVKVLSSNDEDVGLLGWRKSIM